VNDKTTTMCITEAVARMNVLKDKEQDGDQWLTLHSMIATLYILKDLGFKRVTLEVYDVPI
jgi:squalene cyclase